MGPSSGRLYERLQSKYQIRDQAQGEALKALLSILEKELDLVERDLDRLYRNWFIETCQERAVPYLADLIGAGDLKPYDSPDFSLRTYVADTLAYRRRKGTASALEPMARDITGWPARVVECFKILSTTPHVKHVGNPYLGTVDLRDKKGLNDMDTPFDSMVHTADVHRITTMEGKYNISNLALYACRLKSYALEYVTARKAEGVEGSFTFNPLGMDLRLFNRPRQEKAMAGEIHLPVPLRRRPLQEELETRRLRPRKNRPSEPAYFMNDPASMERPVFEIYADDGPVPIPPEEILICDLENWPQPPENDDGTPANAETKAKPMRVAVDPHRGRIRFPENKSVEAVRVSFSYGFGGDLGGGPYNRSVEKWTKLLEEVSGSKPDGPGLWQIGVAKHAGLHTDATSHSPVVGSLSEALEQWNRQVEENKSVTGIITVMDNATYGDNLTADAAGIRIPDGAALAIVAADWPHNGKEIEGVLERPRGRMVAHALRPHIKSDLLVTGPSEKGTQKAGLVLDGFLVEGKISIDSPVLRRLHVAHCTLGASIEGLKPCLEIINGSEGLAVMVHRSIMGPLLLPDTLSALEMEDSICGEDRGNLGADKQLQTISAAGSNAVINRCTVFGRTDVKTLRAENCIFTGELNVSRQNEGAIRFSYVPPSSHTPSRCNCRPESISNGGGGRNSDGNGRVTPCFSSGRYGDPAFAQLSLRCPKGITAGGENGTEMGAFHFLKQPYREANLKSALDGSLRFGLEAGIFYIT